MTPSFTLQVLEAKHWDLVQKRMNAMAEAAEKLPPEQRLSVINSFNNSPEWEKQFDELAAQIRALDPHHSFLPENNPE